MWYYHMPFYGPVPFMGTIVFLLLVAFPVSKILQRLGFSGWWAVLTLLPGVNLIMLWVLAFATWPTDQSRSSA